MIYTIDDSSQGILEAILLMPLAETIKELVNFILEGVDLIDHASIFLLDAIYYLRLRITQ